MLSNLVKLLKVQINNEAVDAHFSDERAHITNASQLHPLLRRHLEVPFHKNPSHMIIGLPMGEHFTHPSVQNGARGDQFAPPLDAPFRDAIKDAKRRPN